MKLSVISPAIVVFETNRGQIYITNRPTRAGGMGLRYVASGR